MIKKIKCPCCGKSAIREETIKFIRVNCNARIKCNYYFYKEK